MSKENDQMITPKEWGKKHGVPYNTVLNWCKRGWIQGAVKTELPSGSYFSIPADAPKPDAATLKRGRRAKINTLVLDTLQKVGGEKLTEEEIESIKQNHADHFFELAQQASQRLTGAEATTWLARLDYEHENLRAALDYYHHKDAGATRELEMAVFLGYFWENRGYWPEGIEALQRALTRQPSGASSLKARALARIGHLSVLRDDYDTATHTLSESITMSRRLNEKECLAYALLGLGLVHHSQGRHQEAKPLCMESLQVNQETNEEWLTAWITRWLGGIAEAEGDYTTAQDYYQRYLTISEKLQSAIGMASALDSLGVIARLQGDYSKSRQMHEKSLALRQGIGIKNGIAYGHFRLGLLEETMGQHHTAHSHFHTSLSLHQETGNKLGVARTMEAIARIITGTGKKSEAARLYAAADALRASIAVPLSSSEQTQYGHSIASAKKELRADWNKGSRWSTEKAIAYALSLGEATA